MVADSFVIVSDKVRNRLGERLNLAPSGKRFRCNFIEPGLVSYRDVGGDVELLRRETIEACLATAMQNALTIGHVSTRLNGSELQKHTHGKIDNVGHDAATGWFFCEGTVETDSARDRIRYNSRPSCGYSVLGFGPGGVWHGIPYTREITAISFHHLAIVDNPRYEGADFRLNSKPKQETPAMFKWIKNIVRPKEGGGEEPAQETGTIAPEASIEIDGKAVRMNDLVDAHKAKATADAAEAKRKSDEAAAAGRNNEIALTDTVELDGKPVAMSDLVASYQARENAKNETPEQKQAREAAAAKAARAAGGKADEVRENAGTAHFKVLASARATPPPVQTERHNSADTVDQKIARGAERYGSGKN